MPIKRQTIRDHTAEANLFARRAVIALVIVAVLMGVVLSNLYNLQVNQFEDYQTRSNGNRIKLLPVAPNRGLILDRNGVILAENIPVFSLNVIPEDVEDIDAMIAGVRQYISISDEQVEDFKSNLKSQRRFKPVALRTRLSQDEVARFSVHQHRFSGVTINARLARHYPFGSALTHVVGYVAKINRNDLNKLEASGQAANYDATHDIGKLGIERFYEERLHGTVGYQQVEVNNQGRILRTLDFQPPIPGEDLVLNIDIELQLEIQRLMAENRGAVVVTDPRNGAVLAMYSNPSYDPNLFVHGISSRNYNALLNSTERPLINRVTQGQYPPASTIKPHLALVGLEQSVITPETIMQDRGRYQIENVSHTWRDWKRGGHGDVDVIKAVEVSCDTFFYDLAFNLGIDAISSAMMEFGFGDYTGIDIHEESDANMPTRGWKRAQMNEPWYIGDTIPVGIGQGFWTATPIQINSSINMLINRGEKVLPQILKGVQTTSGVVDEGVKTARPIDVNNAKNWDMILDSMYGTVNREHGTARLAYANTPYIAAGKTGTAQLFTVAQDEEYVEEEVALHLRDNAMYVGYAPYNEPEISVALVLENAGGGSSNAAPLSRDIMDFYFRHHRFDKDGNLDNSTAIGSR
ncbi:penicillin-binding protein 2 [Alteromonas sp. ASW11-36]|uniref:Peptidoglycan D,D-transpeptidase MrdA n=1 Tax=Alteromonas arenosi TaxID=3055817 RepID=A0ABT7SWR6_9ALTE|nr:penicillin-binding protein 2 [Alteromonas sp. ASW11-36]MDM7860630.1 penicillin-binding protein 2 [Alteromonas sp. ASW11-36]